jgi:hypothetical protein
MKVYVEHGGKDPSILNLGINCGCVVSYSRSDYIIPGALDRKLVGREAIPDTVVMKRKLQITLPVIEP